MSKDIKKKEKYEIVKRQDNDIVEIVDPVSRLNPFINFSYSYKSVSLENGRTQVRSKTRSFVNGKMEAEDFNGTLDENAYYNMANEMQNLFSNQISSLLNSFSLFLPFNPKR